MNLRASQRDDPEVNLTSLIDVVLLLLIFFMVSTSFVRESDLKITLPQASQNASATPDTPPLEITVTEQGQFLVNQQALVNNRPDTLRRALLRVAGERRDVPVTLRADARASHQAVVTAMDVAARLGFVHVNIATMNLRED